MTTKPKKAKKSIKPTTSNGPKSKQSKPRAPTFSHVPTPWAKLRQMWEAGESYEAMAKATDAHYDGSKPDPTKPTRAKIWKARNIGVKIDGKLAKFGARGKAKPKPQKNGSHKKVPKKKAKPVPETTGQVEVGPQKSISSDLEQK